MWLSYTKKYQTQATITVIKTITHITVETMTPDELKTKVEELEALIQTVMTKLLPKPKRGSCLQKMLL
jgi:hypothetical protein